MKKTPWMLVVEKFEDKDKLVAAVSELATEALWLDRVNELKGLGKVSNAKLLRLHEVLSAVKEKYGSREKLIAAILDVEKRTPDAGYKARLESFATPRLWDLLTSTSRRAKRVTAKSAAAVKPSTPKKKLARSKKAQAKARAAA